MTPEDIIKIVLPSVVSAIVTGIVVVVTVKADLKNLKEWTGSISKALRDLVDKVEDWDRESMKIIGEVKQELGVISQRVTALEKEVDRWSSKPDK